MSNMDLIWIAPLMLVLLVLKGFFSGSEIALVSADRIKLGRSAKQGTRGARLVMEAFRHPERVLTTTLVGTNLATVTLTTLGTLITIHYLGNEAGDLFAFLIFTPLLLILGEIVPKAIYQEKADQIAPIVIFPLRTFSWIFFPIVWLFASVARFATRRVGAPPTSKGFFAAREQLRAMAEMAERASSTGAFDRFRIERAIRFQDATVGQRMVPAAEIVAIGVDASVEQAASLVRRKGHTSLPVYEGNVSNVTGVVTLTPWDLLDPETRARSVRELTRPATYVSPNESLEDLASLLREQDERLAVVVDEYGSATGIITIEDVVEAVVGEIEVGALFDEPAEREQRRYQALDDDTYLIDARLPISELNDLLGLDLPQSEFHTIGGLITARLRRVPREGESILESGYRFTVAEASARRVEKVRAELVQPNRDTEG